MTEHISISCPQTLLCVDGGSVRPGWAWMSESGQSRRRPFRMAAKNRKRTLPTRGSISGRRGEINDLLTQLAALELHNGFTAAGDPTFAGRSEVKTQATLGDLREASPEVDEELKRRLKAKSANE